MLKNYFKIALRNLKKNKIDSTISIGGLAVGLACCILLIFYVRFEWSHDNFHEYGDRVYRITQSSVQPRSGEDYKSVITEYPLAAALDSTFPQIEKVIHITMQQLQIRSDERFSPQVIAFADPGFFDLFTFPIKYGAKTKPLQMQDGVLLTQQKAFDLFGNENALGRILEIKFNGNIYSYEVTGIVENLPENSSLTFDILLPFDSFFRTVPEDEVEFMKTSWHIGFGETWVLLNKNASPTTLQAKFPVLLKKHFGDMVESTQMEMGLQPLSEVYFDQEFSSFITPSTNILYSSILGGIALIILAIAGMNFMSLKLSRATQREHEMGIRKASGALRSQVSAQIFGEVFLTCLLALLLGLTVVELATPIFHSATGTHFEISVFKDPVVWLLILGILLILTLITGAYPAFILAKENTARMFSSARTTSRIPLMVKGLVSAQFGLTIAFLIATITMQNQLEYLMNKDLGYNSSGILSVEIEYESENIQKSSELFAQEVKRLPQVKNASRIASAYRGDPSYAKLNMGFGMGTLTSGTTLPGFEDGIKSEIVDEHYLDVMDLELIAGRNFSPDRPSELNNGIIINQVFADKMGWENPVGKVIEDKADRWTPPFDGKKVIGVVENFHYRPLHKQLQPIALQHIKRKDSQATGTVLVKLEAGSVSQAVNNISALWNTIIPTSTFRYQFLDNLVEMQYQEEIRWKNIIEFSTVMALFLACFGLFGLAALSTQRRTKEIGIRKVLGASLSNIVNLISKDFIKLILTGFFLAIPIAWYAMNHWLSNFAYKIDLGAEIFLISGATALFVALATVSWQSVKAALANPADSLRSE